MRYLRNTSKDPYFNMAFDEFVLERMDLPCPVFYLWQNSPSVIIGMNQNAYAEVNIPYLEENGILPVRRVTGGGAVYHDLQNLNYTIAGRSSDLDKDYPGYLHFMVDALRSLGVDAFLSGRNDIMVDGRKCSGYAKRVYKDRLMVHGTLMYDVDLDKLTKALSVPGSKLSSAGIASVRSKVANLKDYLPEFSGIEEFQSALHEIMSRNEDGSHDAELFLSESQLREIESFADSKFRTWEWIFGRSPKAEFRKSSKFKCGTVEVHYGVNHGLLTDVRFGGDYIGNLPTDELERLLEGVRDDEREILKVLRSGRNINEYFDLVTEEEILSLFKVT
ncbi:MAG: lipoate--protein ligase [Bacteroidales bacterium]|nr:lipoate--protein ligase [Bacteroidales bacterium]